MKKAVSILIVLLLFVSLFISCSSVPSGMDEQYYKYGMKALSIADSLLDFDITVDEAFESMRSLEKAKSTLPEYNHDDFPENLSVEIYVASVSWSITTLKSSTRISSSDLLEKRNSLAKILGVKLR